MVLLCSWFFHRWQGPLQAAALVTALLLWLCYDAVATRRALDAEVYLKLAVQLKVAAFAQGSPGPDGGHGGSCGALRFKEVQRRTHCAFAATAAVWGNDWDGTLAEDGSDAALAANIAGALPRFYRFCLEVRAGAPLDAFVFEARGARLGSDLPGFARTVRLVLAGISAADPAGVHCFRESRVGRRGWYFQFARESFFVTTFAPCYPPSSPRYQFGAHPESCFVLFQPEESFLRHDLPPDKPRSATKWEPPYSDVRDRIRAAFRRSGREYRIPETTAYPPAEFIVAPLRQLDDPPVEFWKT